MKFKTYYFILQEKEINNSFWFDIYDTCDRRIIEDMLKIFRRKRPYNSFRVVRLIQ